MQSMFINNEYWGTETNGICPTFLLHFFKQELATTLINHTIHFTIMKKAIPHLSILFLIITSFIALTTEAPVAINIALATLTLFGAYMSITSIQYSLKSLLSKNWPQTLYKINEGEIRSVSIEGERKYSVAADLEYSVGGITYSKDIRDDYNMIYFDTHEQAENYLNGRLNEKYQTIYYNPKKPGEAMLEPGFDIRPILAAIIGFAFVYAGIGILMGLIDW